MPLIYAPKQEMPSILRGINSDSKVILLNRFDDRGTPWDIRRDVREPRIATEAAFTLIPAAMSRAQQPTTDECLAFEEFTTVREAIHVIECKRQVYNHRRPRSAANSRMPP